MGLTRKERRARERRQKLEAARAALDAAARRQANQAMKAEAADRRIFAKDAREAPYQWPARNRRRGARWPEEAA